MDVREVTSRRNTETTLGKWARRDDDYPIIRFSISPISSLDPNTPISR